MVPIIIAQILAMRSTSPSGHPQPYAYRRLGQECSMRDATAPARSDTFKNQSGQYWIGEPDPGSAFAAYFHPPWSWSASVADGKSYLSFSCSITHISTFNRSTTIRRWRAGHVESSRQTRRGCAPLPAQRGRRDSGRGHRLDRSDHTHQRIKRLRGTRRGSSRCLR